MFALVAHRDSETNRALVACRRHRGARILTPEEALARLGPGDVALGRLDVRPTLDGIEPGLRALASLADRGVTVLNPPSALLTAHDKLLTARALTRAGLPHPRTRLVLPGDAPDLAPPVVVKPRFGSWGRDVVLCRDRAELDRTLVDLAGRPWAGQGALVQELVPPRGFDLRLVVAAGAVVGAAARSAAPGEWRTNVALGGTRVPTSPPPAACALAVAAAAAADADLVGIDLLPGRDGWIVLELNGAVDFTRAYAREHDVYEAAVSELLAAASPFPEIAAARA